MSEARGKKNKAPSSSVHYGEETCQHSPCSNLAYYEVSGSLFCGVHSKNKKRKELPKFTASEKKKHTDKQLEKENEEIEEAAEENRREGKKGEVIVTKLRMMKNPEYNKGFLKVFPNFKHQGRKDGYGCMKLSPMFLGPVKHGQPDLPDSLNIENFHQGSKCFDEEVDDDGNPSEVYDENRERFYNDPVPHRHKYHGKEKNKNIPRYFVWRDKEGEEHKLHYIHSRQFYCNFYERLAREQEDYKILEKKREEGYNLQIVGYDGRGVEGITMEEAYLDARYPFGHELVLYSMLITEEKEKLPWRVHKTFDF